VEISITKPLQLVRKKINSSSGSIIMAQSLATLLLFTVDIVFARSFSTELFGTWKQLLLISNFLLPLCSFGVIDGFKYFAAKEQKDWKSHYLTSLIWLIFIAILLVIVCLIGGGFLLSRFFSNPLLMDVCWVFPLIYLSYSFSTSSKYAVINQGLEKSFLKAMIISVVVSSILFAFALLFRGRLSQVEIILTLGYSLAFGHISRFLFMHYTLRGSVNAFVGFFDRIKKFIAYGFPLYLTSFLTIIILNIDKTIVSYYTGAEGFAIYSIGAKDIPFLSIISSSVYQANFPKLVSFYSNSEVLQAAKLWIRLTITVSRLTYPLILFFLLISEPAVIFLYGEPYQDSVRIFQTYLLVLLWRNNYYGALLSASGKTKWITIYSVIALVLNTILSLGFYALFGVLGVIYATFLTVSIVNILQMRHEKVLGQTFMEFLRKPILIFWIALILVTYFLYPVLF